LEVICAITSRRGLDLKILKEQTEALDTRENNARTGHYGNEVTTRKRADRAEFRDN
jgi:hypothetical protein